MLMLKCPKCEGSIGVQRPADERGLQLNVEGEVILYTLLPACPLCGEKVSEWLCYDSEVIVC